MEPSDKYKFRDFLQNNWPVLLKNIKIKIDRNCSRLKDINETQQPNPTHDPGLDLSDTKEIIGTVSQTRIEPGN